MHRNIIDVIDKLKPILIEQNIDISELDSIRSSKQFAPPELDYLHWGRLQQEIVSFSGDYGFLEYDQFPDWLKKVSDIITDKDIN